MNQRSIKYLPEKGGKGHLNVKWFLMIQTLLYLSKLPATKGDQGVDKECVKCAVIQCFPFVIQYLINMQDQICTGIVFLWDGLQIFASYIIIMLKIMYLFV